jgi:uncharacterized membrane protein HdeD (DUF308 family)
MGVGMSIVTGLLAIALGIILLAWPGITLGTFIWVFGIVVIAYGVVHALGALFGYTKNRWGGVLGGLVAIVIGAIVVAWPGLAATTVIWIVALLAILMGLADVLAGFAGEMSGGARVLAIVGGIISIVFGIVIFAYPASGILAILWLVGIYLVFLGFFRIVTGVFAPAGRRRPGLGGSTY